MPKSLPRAWQLVIDTWQLFLATWNDSIKISIWFLYFGLLYFALYVVIHFVPVLSRFSSLIEIAILVVWSWTIIRLIDASLRAAEGKSPDDDKKNMQRAWKLLPQILWVGLLHAFILLGSCAPLLVWGALVPSVIPVAPEIELLVSVALLAPIFYVGVCLSLVQLVAIDEEQKGMRALVKANSIVRGRWWDVFQRQLVAFVAFGFLVWSIASVLFLILGMIVGPEKFLLLANPKLTDPLLSGIFAILEGMLQAVFMPLFILYFVKLYKSLKNA